MADGRFSGKEKKFRLRTRTLIGWGNATTYEVAHVHFQPQYGVSAFGRIKLLIKTESALDSLMLLGLVNLYSPDTIQFQRTHES